MICCGMAVKRLGILAVSVRKMKELTVKMETLTLLWRLIESDMLCVLSV